LTADYRNFLDAVLYMNWLRPENVPWDVHAATLIAPHLQTDERKLEIGIGNGYTSFTLLGGRFKPAYDWYYNVDVAGFWKNRDIYDHLGQVDVAQFIESFPGFGYELAIDHKANLISQARQLKISREYLVADGNAPFAFPDVDVVFSNIIYWLKEPEGVLSRLAGRMKPSSKLIVVIPNSRYFGYSRSFAKENRMWTLLNRGRADLGMWSMDEQPFARMIDKVGGFVIEDCRSYLSRQTLTVHDIGLRPFSPYLIRMANALSASERLEIKHEWCEGLRPLLTELVEEELEAGKRDGGFNFYVLRRTA
jgi:SAM-dependent methyltransferase